MPIGSVIWLKDGVAPSESGMVGEWIKLEMYLTTTKTFCLDVENGNQSNGTNVRIYGYNGSEGQQWHWYNKNAGQIWAWLRTA